jgi:hypothetical protein
MVDTNRALYYDISRGAPLLLEIHSSHGDADKQNLASFNLAY